MTLPTSFILPNQPTSTGIENVKVYLEDLTVALQDMYQQIALTVNGDIRADAFQENEQWIPTLQGSTNGTFTYSHQSGWVLRQGLITDIWFDVQWSATTASGNLYIELPYEVAMSAQMPFMGVCQPSGFAYTGGTEVVINGIPSTYRGEFWNTGTGFTTANQSVVASGRIIGTLRYIGIANEP